MKSIGEIIKYINHKIMDYNILLADDTIEQEVRFIYSRGLNELEDLRDWIEEKSDAD